MLIDKKWLKTNFRFYRVRMGINNIGERFPIFYLMEMESLYSAVIKCHFKFNLK
jgi:hypothetical protein